MSWRMCVVVKQIQSNQNPNCVAIVLGADVHARSITFWYTKWPTIRKKGYAIQFNVFGVIPADILNIS